MGPVGIYSHNYTRGEGGEENTLTFQGLLDIGSQLKLILCDLNCQEKVGSYYAMGPRKTMCAIHRYIYGYFSVQILLKIDKYRRYNMR